MSRIAGKASQDGVSVDPALLQSLVAREAQHREGLGRELASQVSNAPDMTESLADWLKQIEGPLARHAAADKNFFHNSSHPAREIVDGLGHLQMFRANPDLPSEDDPIRERVSQILAPVRDRVRRARQRVVAEIRRRYAGRQVPKLAPELLEVGWRAVLELDAINAADNDERFTMHMGLLDSVVGSLGGEAFESAPLEPDPSRLFECVEKELATVAFDPFRRNALENRLRHALLDPLSEAANGQPMSDRAVDAILVRMEERLANKPTYDSLTGLINRQQFHAAVEKALSMPDRVEDIGVLLWLDIDQFRLVNDVHGYETGDRLLEAVARLLERVKGAKVLGHLGADRFALMLPDIGLADAGGRAEAVCEMVRGMSFDWPGQTIGLSVSIGMVPLAAGSEDFNRLLQSADVSDLSSSAGIIHELKSLGCKVALDDFGSGQASYSYLKQLPVDWLKIDGVFVRKIATNSDDFAVVKSINEIGHFLGKKTIAEYVADDDILAKIREIGVDFAQGFGISPPLLMEDLLQTRQIA